MTKEIPYDKIARYLSGVCSEAEIKELEIWKAETPENKQMFEEMKDTWNHATPPEYEPDVEAALVKTSAKLGEQKAGQSGFSWIKLAAAILIGVGLFGTYKIFIESEKLIEVNTIALVEPVEINLPDGSMVTLNTESVLKYPRKFRQNIRKIVFEGEAYFQIAPDKVKPFLIESNGSTTKVVGTEFNLKSFKGDSEITLNVTEGLVFFNYEEHKEQEIQVAAGEVARINKIENTIQKSESPDRNFIAWRTGILEFRNKTIKDILPEISRFYKTEFECDSNFNKELVSITFNKQTIQEAIEDMELVFGVQIIDKEGKYILKQIE
ncbi:MAG: FecR domain-containing protein [Bacteroidales bacterium]|nr:FecR domain-containing protein [Bacteroidales bacterium]MBN2820854.1 FecR domain-containing protein [Bacteroidales bacterium]